MSIRIAVLLLITTLFLGACNNVPNHARYIPKDASAVVSLNTSALGKKIAWNAIWGSKLMDEMKKTTGKQDAMKDVENSGVKVMTTYYAYMKNDKRYEGGNKITAIIPLDDAAKWETYLKTINPNAVIKAVNDRKETMLSDNVYVGWNKELLIVMNTLYNQVENPLENLDTQDPAAIDSMLKQMENGHKPDEMATAAEMDKAFNTPKDNAITNDKHFMELEKAGHDISLWVNYETLGNEYMMNPAMTGGLALSNSLWKDAAMTMGFDFEKGSIKGKMLYYISDDLKDVFKEMGKDNVDKELVERLPADKLNLIAGWNISPVSIRKTLEKMNVLGLANAGLAAMGITTDEIFEAFSGDMGLTLNNFNLKSVNIPADSLFPGQQLYQTSDADLDYTFAIKIGKKTSFDKLVQLAVRENMLIPAGANSYMIPSGGDTVYVMISDKYLVAANSLPNAANYIDANNRGHELAENAKIVTKNPMGLYLDVKSSFGNIGSFMNNNTHDSATFALTRNLLSDVTVYGGSNKGNTFKYNLSVNFVNKEENSLLQLIDYAGKVSEKQKEEPATASR